MEYVGPLDGAPGASFVQGDGGLGVEGSVIPAGALENAQREIVNVIAGAGITPNGGNLSQLLEAMLAIAAQASSVEPGRFGFTARKVTPPAGWLFCHGQAVSRTTYANLFAEIGTDYGPGDGSTTFNVPNYQDRFMIGASGTRPVGDSGGLEDVTLTLPQIPPHPHAMPHTHSTPSHPHTGPAHPHVIPSYRVTVTGGPSPIDVLGSPGAGAAGPNYSTSTDGATSIGPDGSGTSGNPSNANTSPAGGGESHTNMPPWRAANVIIKT